MNTEHAYLLFPFVGPTGLIIAQIKDATSAFLTSKRFMLLPKFEICIAPAAGIEPGPLGPKAQVITSTPASQLITGVKNSV